MASMWDSLSCRKNPPSVFNSHLLFRTASDFHFRADPFINRLIGRHSNLESTQSRGPFIRSLVMTFAKNYCCYLLALVCLILLSEVSVYRNA